MKDTYVLIKRPIAIVLAGLFLTTQAAWAEPSFVQGVGGDYQAVLSITDAQAKQDRESAPVSRAVSTGFSSLSLTKPDAEVQEPKPITDQEKKMILQLYEELLVLIPQASPSRTTSKPGIEEGPAASRQTTELEAETVQQPREEVVVTFLPVSDGTRLTAKDSRPGLQEEKPLLESIPQEPGLVDFQFSGQVPLISNSESNSKASNREPYQQSPVFFDVEKPYESFLPEAVLDTGLEMVTNAETPHGLQEKKDSEVGEAGVNQGPMTDSSVRPRNQWIQSLLTLLDNFELILGPQEIEETPAFSASSEAAVSASQTPFTSGLGVRVEPWTAAVVGAVAEMLRLSAEQLRNWLYEVEAFDQGSLRERLRNLRHTLNYLLLTGEERPVASETMSQDGYRVISSVDLDPELAALHVLANPPRIHPFIRHMLFETQAVPDQLKRYWFDVEKLKAIYASAGTTDEDGHVYFIRYRGKILDNPYRPMPDDLGGRYELVVAE